MNGTSDCRINTFCGNQVAKSATRAAGDASRSVAGTCDDCEIGTWGENSAADCINITECRGTTDGGTTKRIEVINATATADRTCTECAGNFWVDVGDNTNCVANTACGMQVNGTAGDRLNGASRTAAGTCDNCKEKSLSLLSDDAEHNCMSHTHGFAYIAQRSESTTYVRPRW